MPVTAKTKHTGITKEDTPHTSPTGRRRPRLLTVLFSLLLLLAGVHFIAVMHEAQLAITTTTCPGLIRNTDYTKFVQLQGSQTMGAVQFVDQLVGGQPAALVQVTHNDAQHTMDTYIYGCGMQQHAPTLTMLFKQQGLVQGTVSVSPANTLVIGERDVTIQPGSSVLLLPLQENVYQEYSWRNGTFVEIPFPGLYPVTNRSGAEALQTEANNGQTLPWRDPLVTAQQMAADIFHWPVADPRDTLLNNDGTTAHVLLVQQHPGIQVTATLTRLVQHNNAGLWFVTAAQTQGITLNQAHWSTPLMSPIDLQGTVNINDGETAIVLFDHTLNAMSALNNAVLVTKVDGSYTGSIYYTNNVPNQQGLLLIESIPPGASKETGQLLLTGVILG